MPIVSDIAFVVSELDTSDQDALVKYLYQNRREGIKEITDFLNIIQEDYQGPAYNRELKKNYKNLVYVCNWINAFGNDPRFLKRMDLGVKKVTEPAQEGAQWNLIPLAPTPGAVQRPRRASPESYTDGSDINQTKQEFDDRATEFRQEDHLNVDNGRNWIWWEPEPKSFPDSGVYRKMDEDQGTAWHARSTGLKLAWRVSPAKFKIGDRVSLLVDLQMFPEYHHQYGVKEKWLQSIPRGTVGTVKEIEDKNTIVVKFEGVPSPWQYLVDNGGDGGHMDRVGWGVDPKEIESSYLAMSSLKFSDVYLPKAEEYPSYDLVMDPQPDEVLQHSPTVRKEKWDINKYRLDPLNEEKFFEMGKHQIMNMPQVGRAVTPYGSVQRVTWDVTGPLRFKRGDRVRIVLNADQLKAMLIDQQLAEDRDEFVFSYFQRRLPGAAGKILENDGDVRWPYRIKFDDSELNKELAQIGLMEWADNELAKEGMRAIQPPVGDNHGNNITKTAEAPAQEQSGAQGAPQSSHEQAPQDPNASEPEIGYIAPEDIVELHESIVATYGGNPELYPNTVAKLEAAIGRMQSGAFDREFYPSLLEKAAVLMHSIITSHPFVDGNKRTAYMSGVMFLHLNHMVLEEAEEAADVIVHVAEGKLGYEALHRWLTENVTELTEKHDITLQRLSWEVEMPKPQGTFLRGSKVVPISKSSGTPWERSTEIKKMQEREQGFLYIVDKDPDLLRDDDKVVYICSVDRLQAGRDGDQFLSSDLKRYKESIVEESL